MPSLRMSQRRGTAAEWIDANPVLLGGEIGLETDTGLFKFGNGSSTWVNLSYSSSSGSDPGAVRGVVATDIGTPGSDIATALSAKIADALDGIGGSDVAFLSSISDPYDGAYQASKVATERTRLTNLFPATGTRVALGRSGNNYDLYQELDSLRWWKISLNYDVTAGGVHHSLYQSVIGIPQVTIDQGDASFAYSATSWVTSAQALTFGGSFARNDLTGATATWTTPAACKSVGIRAFRSTNGGYSVITIDGSPTAATLLPTAQDEVTAGRLAASALISGGGTLNPTDRLYNSYGPTSDTDLLIWFAHNLTSATHTVVWTNTGYKQGISSSTRMYISGGIMAGGAITPATSGVVMDVSTVLLSSSSVYEYAISFTPAGGTTTPFIGNRHGNEVETAFVLKEDGTTVTPANGVVLIGSTIQVDRTNYLTHPDTGATNIANTQVGYTMTPTRGLDVHADINWLVGGTAYTTYLAMMPTQTTTMDKGRAAAGPVVTLTADDGSVRGSTRSDTLALWKSGGNAAVLATVRNLPTAVNRWVGATSAFAWIEDRLGGSFNKGYFQRVQTGSTEAVVAGSEWESYINYRVAFLASTAAFEV